MAPFRIVIACDASTDVQVIADDLQLAGLPADAAATVLSVADLLPLPAAPETGLSPAARRAREHTAAALREVQQVADRAKLAFHATFPRWKISSEVDADGPVWAIVKKAHQSGANLIVLSSHKASVLRRLVLGSVSQGVLAHAEVSVRIVRPLRVAARTPRLLIGIDGSPAAEAAVTKVATRAWPAEALAKLVIVRDPTLLSLLEVAPDSTDADLTDRVAEPAAARLRTAGLTVSTAVVPGSPRHVLVEEADTWNATSLFVGAQGLRAIDRLLLGSVSAAAAAHAHCSVEIVRP